MQGKLPPLLGDLVYIRQQGVLNLLLEALLTGLFAGLVIGAFRLSYNFLGVFLVNVSLSWVVLGIGLFIAALISYILLEIEPLISGSGIPQVELMLRGLLAPMRFARVLFCKFWGTLIALSAGLSLGREGPCIQMGAAVGLGVGTTLHKVTNQTLARFLIGGSVAGMTAAFGAPIAGLLFAFEEMRTVLNLPMLLFCAISALTSYLVVEKLFDLGLVFPFASLMPLSIEQSWLVLVIALATGFLSVAYNFLLVGLTLALDKLKLPKFGRILMPFILTWGLFLVYPYVLTNFGLKVLALEDISWGWLALFGVLLAKMAFSAVSFASGVSGGLLMPMLTAGALLGAVLAKIALALDLITQGQQGVFLTLAMAGLFAGTVRAPLTGGFLLLEMTSAWTSTLPILAVALISGSICNHLNSEPVYDSLKRRILNLKAKDTK